MNSKFINAIQIERILSHILKNKPLERKIFRDIQNSIYQKEGKTSLKWYLKFVQFVKGGVYLNCFNL